MKKPTAPLIRHNSCHVIARYVENKGPHRAELWCLDHQQHIIWLSQSKAEKIITEFNLNK